MFFDTVSLTKLTNFIFWFQIMNKTSNICDCFVYIILPTASYDVASIGRYGQHTIGYLTTHRAEIFTPEQK